MIDYILTIVAIITAMIAYVIYYMDIKKSRIIPNRLSWIIWSLSISLETLTYSSVVEDQLKSLYFLISSLCCIFITIKIWTSSNWKGSSRNEKGSLVFYSVSFIIWPLIQFPLIAHLLLLIAIPVTFIPTYKSSIRNFKNEDSIAWLLWSISDLIIIITICMRLKTVQELPYAIVEFICHFSVFAIITFQRIHKSNRSYTYKFYIRKLYIRGSKLLSSLIPDKAFKKVNLNLIFKGTMFF
jgi:hypothetical protein